MDWKLSLVLSSILLAQYANAIDYEGAKERACFEPKETIPVDMEWMSSIKTIYYPAQHRFDLYTVAKDLFGNLEDIPEDKLYYESCTTWEFNATDSAINGWGKRQAYKMKALDSLSSKVQFTSETGGTSGFNYNTLTDNKTFIFSVSCFTDVDQMIWGVHSPYKVLPKETLKIIHEHAKELGFEQQFFSSQRYDTCDNDERDFLLKEK